MDIIYPIVADYYPHEVILSSHDCLSLLLYKPYAMPHTAIYRQLEKAIAENHCELYALHARLMGGYARSKNGLRWTNAGNKHGGVVLFPQMAEEEASALLDDMMADFAAHPPKGLGAWSLQPVPEHLDGRLLARGFQLGWKPCWMIVELAQLQTNFEYPAGLNIQADNTTPIEHLTDLPYSGNDMTISSQLIQAYPERVQRFLATLNGEIVGQSAVFFTADVAGIYNVSVMPLLRSRGIGRAVTIAACAYALQRGYQYAVLNASMMGQPVYEQIGFQKTGDGMTWWMNEFKPVPAEEVVLAEAVALGQISKLTGAGLNTPITNGMTLMQLAAHCKQHAAADWLITNGAEFTALDAWDLGWIERATDLFNTQPGEINRLYTSEFEYTLLHIAAQRNDVGLARLALANYPDITIKDKQHNGTALDWARFFRRTEIHGLIVAYEQMVS